ncbi:MAG: aspartate--tRNA ligase [Spirochaetes bacterium]|nr:aspartate--tRNA ligase [Spirochaetota bacterium]
MYTSRSYCGELTLEMVGNRVELAGWVESNRNLGGIIFMKLRDVTGTVQMVVDSSASSELLSTADQARSEFVVRASGTVRKRDPRNVNPDLPTGAIEVVADSIIILNASLVPPIPVDVKDQTGEDLRLKYRYIDLRREDMRDAIIKRHRAMMAARRFLSENRFFEIETPVLNKSTPEGARDFLVPSRNSIGEFYALPQSPQLFKQILMISGFDRYFQIVKCFRDEDLRNDRQPEFTQIDLELSFIEAGDIMRVVEGLLQEMVREVTGREIKTPFRILSYREAMDRYGTDAPDTRFGLELSDCGDIFSNSDFTMFTAALADGGVVRGIAARDDGKISRKMIDQYAEEAKVFGIKGLPMCRYTGSAAEGGIAKYLKPDDIDKLRTRFNLSGQSILFFAAGSPAAVSSALANVRIKLGRALNLIDEDRLEFLWVTDFPLFEYSRDDRRFYSKHHPFTAPRADCLSMLASLKPEEAERVIAQAYDVVLNGVEIGGGSIRINNPDVQSSVFSLLGISREEAEMKFSFLIDALGFGAPPHGGIALGLDRIMMLLLRRKSIRDVIAFPKTTRGQCLMSNAPSPVSPEQLEELNLKVIGK